MRKVDDEKNVFLYLMSFLTVCSVKPDQTREKARLKEKNTKKQAEKNKKNQSSTLKKNNQKNDKKKVQTY